MVPWIKVEHITPDKPEIILMAENLGVDQDAIVGKCLRVWIWADQQTISGNAATVTFSFLDRLTNCPGFASQLVAVGWLVSRSGRLQLPNFDRHNGQTAKNRALSTDRVQRHRNAATVTKSLPELELEEDIEVKKKNTPLPPRGKRIEKPAPELFSHPWLNIPELKAAWEGWIEVRKKLRKPPTLRAMALAMASLQELSGDDTTRAIVIIDQSTANAYQGFFPLKESYAKPKPNHADRLDDDAKRWSADIRRRRENESNPRADSQGSPEREQAYAGG
jgi:hypothetical protein